MITILYSGKIDILKRVLETSNENKLASGLSYCIYDFRIPLFRVIKLDNQFLIHNF